MVYCLVGVALFSIFTGAVYEALGDSLADFAEAKAKIDYSKLKQDFIREHREYFFGVDAENNEEEENETAIKKKKTKKGPRKNVTLLLEPEFQTDEDRKEVD